MDPEFEAMQLIYKTLENLSVEARIRVIQYVHDRLDISAPRHRDKPLQEEDADAAASPSERENRDTFSTFAELYDAIDPGSNAEKALVAGYWLQECQDSESFDSQSANRELKHLGHGLANITAALDQLKNSKPALALQLKKSGKSQQARKTYKVTGAGTKWIIEQLNKV